MDHPAFDDANPADRRSESSFARLAASGRPALDRILLDLAAVYREVARRASVQASLFTGGRDWYVALEDGDELLLVAQSPYLGPIREALDLRRSCSHELAYRVLAELCRLFRVLGDYSRLAHALQLQELVPVRRGLGQSLCEGQEG